MVIFLTVLVVTLLISQVAGIFILRQKNTEIKKIKKLFEIGEKITSNIKIKQLVREIMETAEKETGAEACSLYLIDEEKQELWFEVALGEKGDRIKEIRLKMGEGVAGWVAKEGVTLNLKDANQDSRFKKEIGISIEFKCKAMLTMPIKFKDKIIGVIQLINKTGSGFFSKQDEEFIAGMSSQVAIALENAKLYKAMRDMFIDSISSLASAIDAKDPYTNGHSQRVTEYSLGIGREMGLSEEQLEALEYTAVLHDVGKIGIKDMILNKQSQLDDEEYAIMKSHTVIGARILSSMKSLEKLTSGAKYHHEKFDGSGYFEHLKGDEIPIEARIISVADTYDAMTTDRPYRKGLQHEIAVQEVTRCAGTQFDPEVVKCFSKVMQKKMVSDNEV